MSSDPTALPISCPVAEGQKHTWESDISTDSTPSFEPWERAGFQSALEAKTVFFDNLSKIPLCYSALKELNRRNLLASSSRSKAIQSTARPVKQNISPNLQNKTNEDYTRELKNFAKRGGPDLCDLRGVRRRPVLTIQANELPKVSRILRYK